ncbi:MAG: DUF3307 domain-containing protein [Eubacteriales bacterium]|nr:DUF3307 domain-containing protein [Eubacteriales bacterium]
MISKYLLLLGIGHITGDFYFQTDEIAKEKDIRFRGVVKHSIEYLLSTLLVIIPVISADIIKGAVALSITHFLIDSIKYLGLKKKIVKKSARLFLYDQCAHVISILFVSYVMYINQVQVSGLGLIADLQRAFGISGEMFARWALAILIIHNPSNILIQVILKENRDGRIEEKDRDIKKEEIDNKAGRKIGTIERLIMLLFIAIGQYTAMGVVLTAKSIARFDRIAKEKNFAEDYLLGTLLSTACVVLCKVILL